MIYGLAVGGFIHVITVENTYPKAAGRPAHFSVLIAEITNHLSSPLFFHEILLGDFIEPMARRHSTTIGRGGETRDESILSMNSNHRRRQSFEVGGKCQPVST